MPVLQATLADLTQILSLLNSAYRGDASKKGWTSEADLLIGEHRTDMNTLNALFQTEGVTFFKI